MGFFNRKNKNVEAVPEKQEAQQVETAIVDNNDMFKHLRPDKDRVVIIPSDIISKTTIDVEKMVADYKEKINYSKLGSKAAVNIVAAYRRGVLDCIEILDKLK